MNPEQDALRVAATQFLEDLGIEKVEAFLVSADGLTVEEMCERGLAGELSDYPVIVTEIMWALLYAGRATFEEVENRWVRIPTSRV